MEDEYRQRQIDAIEQQSYEHARQNQLAAVQARLDTEMLALDRYNPIAPNGQIVPPTVIDYEEQVKDVLSPATVANHVINATNNVAAATNHVANVLERGQRALVEVEMANLRRRKNKDESKEFSHAQEHKIYALWARLPKLNEPATPGAKLMLLEGMRDELADIAIDAVHDIAFLDRDNETKKIISDGFVAVLNESPELAFIATDYHEKIALAKRLQEQPRFASFADTTLAGRLRMLREKFPELKIPNDAAFPAKSRAFAQDVARLKNLCAFLGIAGKEKDEPAMMAIVMTAFPALAPAICGEEDWAAIPTAPLSPPEVDFYYRLFRDRLTFDAETPTDALERVLRPLAGYLAIDARSVANLRHAEDGKRREVADIDAEIEGIFAAQRLAEEKRERERQRQERAAKEAEEQAKREAERVRQEKERRRQELERMEDDLIDALFTLLSNCPTIESCIRDKSEIILDDTLLARSHEGRVLYFGNRVQWLAGKGDDYSIVIFSWRHAVETYLRTQPSSMKGEPLSEDEVFITTNVEIMRFLKLFAVAGDVLPQIDDGFDHCVVQLRLPLIRREHVASVVMALAALSSLYGVLSGRVLFIVAVSLGLLFFGGMYLIFDDLRRHWRHKRLLRLLNSPTVESLCSDELCEEFFASCDAVKARYRIRCHP